jgi:hypothetical protein
LETTVLWLLNILILTTASIATGFILGWVAFRPKRWDYNHNTEPVTRPVPAEQAVSLTGRG